MVIQLQHTSRFFPTWLLLIRFMIVCTTSLMGTTGCASLPDVRTMVKAAESHAVKFENSQGELPVSTSKDILKQLKTEVGNLDILQKHLALEQAINPEKPLVLGNKLTLLQDGPSTYKAMFLAIRNARDHINLETYIFEDGKIGEKFVSLLLDKQAQGVQVNIIYDSVGSLSTPKAFFSVSQARTSRYWNSTQLIHSLPIQKPGG